MSVLYRHASDEGAGDEPNTLTFMTTYMTRYKVNVITATGPR